MRYPFVYVEERHGLPGIRLVAVANQVSDDPDAHIFIPPDQIETFEVDPTLLVTDRLPVRRDLTVLLRRDTVSLRSVDPLSPGTSTVYRILVPIGDGPSGLAAYEEAVSVIGVPSRQEIWELHCYHTTWRRDGVDSDDPKDHLDPGVLANLAARDAILRERFMNNEDLFPVRQDHLEIQAPSVVDGIIRKALEIKAAVIVMARGEDLIKGSYVDQMVDVCPVPLLIVAQLES